MEQVNVYDVLGLENDLIYSTLASLTKGETVVFDNIHVTNNEFGLLELNTNRLHETFSSVGSCYKYVCGLLDEKSLFACKS